MKNNVFVLIIMIIGIVSCGSGEEGLKEQTVIQSQEEINAQNQNLEKWSLKLQEDLDKRRSFINAVEGEFEGSFLVGESTYMIRLLISPTIPDYDVNRTRTLAELEFELQNLNLNIQVLQWNPTSELSAVGCIIQDVKPDLKKGVINLISQNCSNTYQVFLSDTDDSAPSSESFGIDAQVRSQSLATQIKDGTLRYVQRLQGKLRSSTNAKIYIFSLSRI